MQLWNESCGEAHMILKVLCDNQLHPYHKFWSAHLFPDNRPLQMQVCKWLRHQHTTDELLLNNILWTKCVLCIRLYSVSTTVTSGCGIIIILIDASIKSAWVLTFKLVPSRTLLRARLLPGRLTAQYSHIPETTLSGCLKVCLYLWGSSSISPQWSSSTL